MLNDMDTFDIVLAEEEGEEVEKVHLVGDVDAALDAIDKGGEG
jgi:hypothetical protein